MIAVFRPSRPGDTDAVLRCVRILRDVQAVIERRDCGTGAGGFKPGNKCAPGGGEGGGDAGGGSSGGAGDSGAGDSRPYSEQHAEKKSAVQEKIETLIARNKVANADHPHAAEMRENISFIADRMAPSAMDRIQSHVKSMSMYESTDELSATVSRLTGRQSNAVGGYNADLGILHMDGGPDPRGTLAHELTHAIDGPKYEISSSSDWQSAWESEIKPGGISNYAGTSPREGLAEFGRAIFSGQTPPKELRTDYPKSWKVLKKYGVIP